MLRWDLEILARKLEDGAGVNDEPGQDIDPSNLPVATELRIGLATAWPAASETVTAWLQIEYGTLLLGPRVARV